MEYKAGTLNGNADALSRMIDDTQLDDVNVQEDQIIVMFFINISFLFFKGKRS